MTRIKLNSISACICLILLSMAAAPSAARTLAQEDSDASSNPSIPTTTTSNSNSRPSSPSPSPSPEPQLPSPVEDAIPIYTGPRLEGQVLDPTRVPSDPEIATELPGGRCPPYIDTQRWRTTDFTDPLNTTVGSARIVTKMCSTLHTTFGRHILSGCMTQSAQDKASRAKAPTAI